MIQKEDDCGFTYGRNSVGRDADCGGGRFWAVNLGRSNDVGCGGRIWDSRDNGGLGATAVNDGGCLVSGESVGLCASSDGGTRGTARDGGGVDNGGGCVGGHSRASGH